MKKDYWKECCLVLIGLILGYFIPKSGGTTHSTTIMKDSVVIDTMYVQVKRIPTLNKANVLAELKSRNIPHFKIVLRQSILETGHYTSKVCKTHNNIFGIRRKGKYVAYDSWIDCVADYEKKISKRYKGGDYYAFLQDIGYAEDQDYINKLKQIKV